jgi:hypothetical protein
MNCSCIIRAGALQRLLGTKSRISTVAVYLGRDSRPANWASHSAKTLAHNACMVSPGSEVAAAEVIDSRSQSYLDVELAERKCHDYVLSWNAKGSCQALSEQTNYRIYSTCSPQTLLIVKSVWRLREVA